jgi:hypothetical protein
VYEVLDDRGEVVERLSVGRAVDQPNRYRWERSVQGQLQPQDLRGGEAAVPFARSDFLLSDLAMEFLHWPEQRLLRIKNAMRKGRSCRVLESRNPSAAPGGYARVVSWVDRDTGGLILAEAFDADNRLLKHFSIGSVTKVNDRWELKDMEIRDEVLDSRSRLEFRYEEQK